MEKGNCKHGEFNLLTGCPECIKEQWTPLHIVKVRYYSDSGKLSEREYTYFSVDPLQLHDVVKVPVRDTVAKAKVSAVNVPEAEIAAFKDKVKTIPAGAKVQPTIPEGKPGDNWKDIKPLPTLKTGREIAEKMPVIDDPAITEALRNREIESGEVHAGPYGVQEWPVASEPFETMQPPSTGPNPPAADIGEVELAATAIPATNEIHALAVIRDVAHVVEPGLAEAAREATRLREIALARAIKSNEDLAPVTNDLSIIGKVKKLVVDKKKEILAPFKSRVDAITAAFDELLVPLTEADRVNRDKVTAFTNEQGRLVAEAARIEAEKLRLAKEEAALKGGEFTVPLNTIQAPADVPVHTRTDMGTLGGRDNWKARVVDFKLLPDEYKLPNEMMLNSFARSTKGTRPIPGVEFWNDRIVTLRQK